MSDLAAATSISRRQFWWLGIVATLMLVPVTLPVPVLRDLVQERFEVGDFATSAFMSINMVGACLVAPLAGVFADRFGMRKAGIVTALGINAVCFYGLTLDLSFGAFLTIRFVEGCAHIFALSLILSLAADVGRRGGEGRSMGIVGAGITLGVALGAPIGGQIGQRIGVLAPLHAGAVISGVLAILVWLWLRDVPRAGSRPGLGALARLARTHRELLVPLAYAFTDRFTVGFFTTTFTLYLKNVHELPVARIGMLLGMFLGPFCLLSYPFGRLSERVSRTGLIAGGSAVYGCGVLSVGFCPVEWLPWLMVTLGALSAVMFVPTLILTTDLAPPEIKSTALGAFNAAGSLGFVVGPLVGGLVTQLVAARHSSEAGYAAAFVVAGASELVCVLLTLGALRRLVSARRTT